MCSLFVVVGVGVSNLFQYMFASYTYSSLKLGSADLSRKSAGPGK